VNYRPPLGTTLEWGDAYRGNYRACFHKTSLYDIQFYCWLSNNNKYSSSFRIASRWGKTLVNKKTRKYVKEITAIQAAEKFVLNWVEKNTPPWAEEAIKLGWRSP